MAFEVEKQFTVGALGVGRPDYTSSVRSIYGYNLTPEESHVWPYLIAITGGGAEPFTGNIEPISPGTPVNLIEAFSGLDYIHCDAGEDYLLKEVYFNFDQPMLWEVLQTVEGVLQHTCVSVFPAAKVPEVVMWHIGWARTLLEDLNAAGDTYLRITNLGSRDATGKVWVIGFKKKGMYRWL